MQLLEVAFRNQNFRNSVITGKQLTVFVLEHYSKLKITPTDKMDYNARKICMDCFTQLRRQWLIIHGLIAILVLLFSLAHIICPPPVFKIQFFGPSLRF